MTTACAAPAAPSRAPRDRGYRSPGELISHAVWRCYRFALGHRDVEERLAERGGQVSDEAIRLWCRRSGPRFAGPLRRRRPRSADAWHLDEVQPETTGKKHGRWRAADRAGLVPDLPVRERRHQAAAERFLRRVLEGEGVAPRAVVTGTPAS